jgi:hypothetical protein
MDGGRRDGERHPHSGNGNVFNTQGMNLVETDGSGRWLQRNECATDLWHVGSPTESKLYPLRYRTVWNAAWNTTNKRLEWRFQKTVNGGFIQGSNPSEIAVGCETENIFDGH